MPKPLGIVHPGRRTPWVAILFTSAIAVVLVIEADLEKLADTTVALLVMVFAVVHLSRAAFCGARRSATTTSGCPGSCR